MLPILLCRELSNFPIAPVALSSLVVASVLVSIYNVPVFRSPIGFSALIAAISQLICTIFVLVDFGTMRTWTQLMIPLFYSLKPVYHLFYAIYVSFMFVPGLIAFGKISKKRNSKIGVFTSYFGYAWTAIVIIVGLALMILILTKLPKDDVEYTGAIDALFRESVFKQVNVLYKVYMFIYLSNWALIAACLIQHVTQFGVLRGKARNSLIAHSTLNIIAVIFNTAVPFMLQNTGRNAKAAAAIIIIFIFVDLTSAVAIIIAVQYGHLWDSDKILVKSQARDVEKVEEPPAPAPAPATT
ncbi:hypothetical protein BDF21DRAFT_452599 [Thamnidium elegans]|nr:hypothetical protein BDF21DRAFT_452599 [Thamnidium elegans]